MPQATDELRNKIAEYFPSAESGISDYSPYKYLMDNGWTEERGLLLYYKPWEEITEQEKDCAIFLAVEWDYDYNRAS